MADLVRKNGEPFFRSSQVWRTNFRKKNIVLVTNVFLSICNFNSILEILWEACLRWFLMNYSCLLIFADASKSWPHILFDNLFTSSNSTTLINFLRYSLEEIAKHNNEESCWLVAHGYVYDATDFLNLHPAGF